ncbi:MAG: PIG-L family deacetylase [Planctomycetes bacterium]|nr:PIG-L family deacetylase [Planctomycetota bacterium]
MDGTKRLLVIGAHPDDADFCAAGLAALWVRGGGDATFVSVTDGSAGHQKEFGSALVARRREEARAAGEVLGIAYEVWDIPDARLEPTLELRDRVIRAIRALAPDLLVTHRPFDFHPDHRYTSILVQDAAYLLTVPSIAPDVPHLEAMPAIGYVYDGYRKPAPFRADVAIDIGSVLEEKLAALFAHASQFLEWLPFNMGGEALRDAPPDIARAWACDFILARTSEVADRSRDALVRRYGDRRAREIRHAEAFEACEYGAPWTDETIEALFGEGGPAHGG